MTLTIKHQWKIDKKLLRSLQDMHPGVTVACPDVIDNVNWGVCITPKGHAYHATYPGKLAINILCLYVPFDVGYMNIEYDTFVNGKSGELAKGAQNV